VALAMGTSITGTAFPTCSPDGQASEDKRLATGAPFGEGTTNFEVMSEWNGSVVHRKALVLFAERLAGP
jgi:membrane-bound lytic murein transglycosylase B